MRVMLPLSPFIVSRPRIRNREVRLKRIRGGRHVVSGKPLRHLPLALAKWRTAGLVARRPGWLAGHHALCRLCSMDRSAPMKSAFPGGAWERGTRDVRLDFCFGRNEVHEGGLAEST